MGNLLEHEPTKMNGTFILSDKREQQIKQLIESKSIKL